MSNPPSIQSGYLEAGKGSKTEEGIPRVLKTAVVLRHGDKPFQASVEVRATTGMAFSSEALPWSNPMPLLFKKDLSFGTALRTPNFD